MKESLEKPFINFHIPKTAGTSLRAALINGFGAEHVAFMMPDRRLARTSDLPFETEELDRARRTARAAGQLSLFSQHINMINRERKIDTFTLEDIGAQGIAVATGHFLHTDVTGAALAIPRTTVLRNPLERAWSHYSHWQEARGTMWWHRGSIAYADDVTFETFATDPGLANYQANCMGDLHFDVIGVSNDLQGFLEQVGLSPTRGVPQLNPGNYRELPAFDPGFVRDFEVLNETDYALYEATLQQKVTQTL